MYFDLIINIANVNLVLSIAFPFRYVQLQYIIILIIEIKELRHRD